jgi:hypothetical protein
MCSSSYHAITIIIPPHPMHILIHLHHTGSQEELPVAVQEEQTGSDLPEAQPQVSEVDEQEEDLPECVDHQPSSFNEASPGAF